MTLLDYERLTARARDLHEQYSSAQPFPHAVLDDFVDAELAAAVEREFAEVDDAWKYYHHYNEKKLAITDLERMPPNTRRLLSEFQSTRFVEFIEALTGIDALIADPTLEGAGMHMIRRGGFLNVHSDFQTHTKHRTWSRRVNLLLYLNRDWKAEWKGQNELWNAHMTTCERSVLPEFNRCLVFSTRAPANHGHPDPLCCPEDRARKSLAVYYYRQGAEIGRLTPTSYQPRPDDSLLRRALIKADGYAIRAVTFLKGRTGLSDETLSRILKRLG